MRSRDHLVLSAAAGLALYGWRPVPLAALIAAGTLLDGDHVLRYALVTGDWSAVGALRYDRYRHRRWQAGDNRPRYGSMRSALHRPWLVLPALWGMALRYPGLRPIAYGISLHLLLDHLDSPQRLLAVARTRGVCPSCGRNDRRLGTDWGWRNGKRYLLVACRACKRYGRLV